MRFVEWCRMASALREAGWRGRTKLRIPFFLLGLIVPLLIARAALPPDAVVVEPATMTISGAGWEVRENFDGWFKGWTTENRCLYGAMAGEGEATAQLDCPADGVYRIWVRYLDLGRKQRKGLNSFIVEALQEKRPDDPIELDLDAKPPAGGDDAGGGEAAGHGLVAQTMAVFGVSAGAELGDLAEFVHDLQLSLFIGLHDESHDGVGADVERCDGGVGGHGEVGEYGNRAARRALAAAAVRWQCGSAVFDSAGDAELRELGGIDRAGRIRHQTGGFGGFGEGNDVTD